MTLTNLAGRDCADQQPRPAITTLRSVNLLKGHIEVSGRTYREIADDAGIGHATLANLARGYRANCTRRTADALAAALGVEVDALFLS